MGNAATLLDLPATPEQLRRAREIIERVCAELGIVGEIDVERYQDPEIPEPSSALFTVNIRTPTDFALISKLTVGMPRALRAEGLYEPVVPIIAIPWPD